jgi:hypothetical protein
MAAPDGQEGACRQDNDTLQTLLQKRKADGGLAMGRATKEESRQLREEALEATRARARL